MPAITDVSGKRSHGVMLKESAKATDPNDAGPRPTPSSVSHSHAPASAKASFQAASSVKPEARGARKVSHVHGANAADWTLPARGVPQPFQRSRNGSSPCLHASRTARAHGANCVTTSFRFEL